jgi:hypothetical protein
MIACRQPLPAAADKKMNKNIALGAIVLLALILNSCFFSSSNRLIGHWKPVGAWNPELTFRAHDMKISDPVTGPFKADVEEYEIRGNEVNVKYYFDGIAMKTTYTFINDDKIRGSAGEEYRRD